ncbi:MAG TPA: septal ring lytic transglycosylase RlpA family protein [Longimicrobiales bacterium]|nr:septal ring lytic transglycosylase RlpA family protein [Longimicrobiales bacterium]
MRIGPLLRISLALAAPLWLGACSLVGYPSGNGGDGPMPASAPATASSGGGSASGSGGSAPARRSDAGRTYEVFGVEYRVLPSADGYDETGMASWYGEAFHGRPTASGEPYDMNGHSAAHRTLPLHTWVEVTNLDNGRSLVVRVNDRGPFAHTDSRILDLSYGAATRLGVVGAGVARVRVRAVSAAEASERR